ncbi:MAG: putative monovalent cation/H+ antiporter subunit A [Geobacter sp.]
MRIAAVLSIPCGLFAWFALQIGAVANGQLLQGSLPWLPTLGIALSFRLDGLGLLFALLISGIGALVLLYASSYLHDDPHLGRFYGFILAFMLAMLGTVLAGDLITLFVFWELTSLCSFVLIGFDHQQEASRKAALQALLVTGAGGLALLGGIILLGQMAGSLELSTLLASGDQLRSHPLYLPLLLLVLAGAFTKSAQFPFQFWLPNAMAAPTPVSAYLHSATMVKLGVFLLARFSPILGGTDSWFIVLTTVGGITLVLGAVRAITCTDLKQILAWTTVSALGMLTLLLGVGTPLAISAALLLVTVHALYKSALFLAAGAVDHGAGSRDINRLGGLASSMPQVALASGLAALSMAGVVPLVGFIAKELLYEATLQAPTTAGLLTLVAFLGNGLTVTAALLAGYLPFYGTLRDAELHPHPVDLRLWLPPLVPAALGLLIGLFPGPAGRLLVAPAVAQVAGSPVPLTLALWHGFSPVLLLSLATLGAGLALFSLRRPLLGRLQPSQPGAGWDTERFYDWLLAGLPRLASGVTLRLQSGRLRYYLMTVTGVAVALMAGNLLTSSTDELHLSRPDGSLHEWLTALVILSGALFATITRSRLAAVASLGVVGYGVALVYILFGAPDLAMTQFCIETLSIILFVLVLHKLPHFTLLSSTASRLRDLMVALGIGTVMTMLVWRAISQPLVPSLSTWFMEQSLPAGHGRNVVNVILVDFRALDTLGEITVLAVAALGVYAMLKPRSGTEGSD